MGITQLNFEGKNKVEVALDRIRQFEPPLGYQLAFSGGKDSIVIYHLAKVSGVKFYPFYNWTGIDPPEVYQFTKQYYPDVEIRRPAKSMWKLIEEHCILPTRRIRFCCEELKERVNTNGTLITGIRWDESARRRKRRMVELCQNNPALKFVHPIIDWTGYRTKLGKNVGDVWEYIYINNLPYPSLYDEGFERLGCILCPYCRDKVLKLQMQRYPKYVAMWKRACDRLFEKGYKPKGCQSSEELFNWWLSRERYKTDDASCPMFI